MHTKRNVSNAKMHSSLGASRDSTFPSIRSFLPFTSLFQYQGQVDKSKVSSSSNFQRDQTYSLTDAQRKILKSTQDKLPRTSKGEIQKPNGILPKVPSAKVNDKLEMPLTHTNALRSTVQEQSPKSVSDKCDKCDGKHPTANCPYYKKQREDHPDAQRRSSKQMGGSSLLPGSFFVSARVVRQPGDGSCLFHSMSYGLGQGYSASRLRNEICNFVRNNPNLLICDTPLKDWVRWDSNSSVDDYCRRMSRGGWGGGIEMAALSQMKQVNVHVYERSGVGFKRISAFDFHPNAEHRPIIRVLYQGGVHYGIPYSFLFVTFLSRTLLDALSV